MWPDGPNAVKPTPAIRGRRQGGTGGGTETRAGARNVGLSGSWNDLEGSPPLWPGKFHSGLLTSEL